MIDFFPAMISILFHGMAFGMILYVISVGLAVTMGLMGFANLAHGVFAMLGGYMTISLMQELGLDFLLALTVGAASVAAASVVLERFLYARLYGAEAIEQVLFTIGLIFVAIAGATYVWGAAPQHLSLPPYLQGDVTLMGRPFPAYRIFIIGLGATITVCLWLGLERTLFGARIRAAVDNRTMARSVGIDTGRLFTTAFALGSFLAALGGGVGAAMLAIHPGYAMEHLIYFLIVVAVGGLNTIRGPFFAALLLGVSDTACKYLAPEVGAFFIYVALFGLLMWKPAGLFGRGS